MKTVSVDVSRHYHIKIGSDLLRDAGQELSCLGNGDTIAIVSDTNVWPLYGHILQKSLESTGFSVISHVFPAGEEHKNGETYLHLLNFLAQNRLTRRDMLLALGGGVVGDLTGFAAATYLRGIRFIQVPTTLLAAVDSSVGGKTAIDLPAGKNLCGAFYQPSLVLCDTDTLNSLPNDIFRDGCAEVIKYAILYDPLFFDYLLKTGLDFDREWVITKCVQFKRDVVVQDEFDTGERKKLNLGHTIGHALESCSRFTLSHGKAVAIGMAIAARASRCPDSDRITACLSAFGLPTAAPYSAEEIFAHTLSDKKRNGDSVDLILPRHIGCCDIVPTPVSRLKNWIEEGI